jgi:TonB family protein
MSEEDRQSFGRSLGVPGTARDMWRTLSRFVLYSCLPLLGACSERTRAVRPDRDEWWRSTAPDVAPQMLNLDVPFRYPMPLYVQRVQGNVLLRLHVDERGQVVPDSTSVVEASGYPALDSAALAGASQLRFRAARRRGVPIAVSMLFPVHFRHPEGPRLPGDSTTSFGIRL